jgi:YD repeat-containing protein
MQIEELVKIGLAETEAKTYLALLELGSGTVTSITHRAGITRTLGYHSLDQLIAFDLVEQKKNSQPAKFHVKHPRKLIEYAERQKNMWNSRVNDAENLLPKLESSYTMLGRPFLSNRIGKEAVLDLYRILYTNKNTLISLLSPSNLDRQTLIDTFQAKSQSNNPSNICCIFDTPENRQALEGLSGLPVIQWIIGSKVHTDVYKSVEIIVSEDTLYTISNKEGELCANSITHEATVSSMYTLLYTLIKK